MCSYINNMLLFITEQNRIGFVTSRCTVGNLKKTCVPEKVKFPRYDGFIYSLPC